MNTRLLNFKRKIKIDREFYLVFAIVFLIATANAVISTVNIKQSKKKITEFSTITNPSLDYLKEIEIMSTRSRMLVTGWVYMPSYNAAKDSLRTLFDERYPELKHNITVLMKKWGNSSQQKSVERIFEEFEEIQDHERQVMDLLTSFDDYQDPVKIFTAESLLENEIIPGSLELRTHLHALTAEMKNQSSMEEKNIIDSLHWLMFLIFAMSAFTIGAIVLGGYILSRSIVNPIMYLRGIVLKMSKGELPDFKIRVQRNAAGEITHALRLHLEGLKRTARFAEEIGKGNFDATYNTLSENDVLGQSLIEMRQRLKSASENESTRTWLSEGIARIANILNSNNENITLLFDEILISLVEYVDAQQGAIFVVDNNDSSNLYIQLGSHYGLNKKILASKRIELKEGLIGQAAAMNKKIHLENVTDEFFTIEAGVSRSKSCNIYIIPLHANGKIVGVLQLASVYPFTKAKQEFIERIAEPIANTIFSTKANLMTKQLLEESQKQAEELAMQKSELKKTNQEILNQSKLLKLSEEELKARQEELKKMNNELEDKARQLEEQNISLESARQSISFKAEQIEQSSKYKSAFLANMSHELRTPLNSILILAKLLSENKAGNLTSKQMEYAGVIHKSGSDLLMLINDILDLSKIEAGKIELSMENFAVGEFVSDMESLFRPLSGEKQINFEIQMDKNVPAALFTDRMRMEQVTKNLLSNAFKFTPKDGKVTLRISLAPHDTIYINQKLLKSEKVIAFAVSDTGIGIPKDKQKAVFEAFKQADGSTSRKYGGTGLGLAISRELSHMLGGDLLLESEEGKGSTFTMYLPEKVSQDKKHREEPDSRIPGNRDGTENNPAPHHAEHHSGKSLLDYKDNEILDDRHDIKPGDKTILVVEDDVNFSRLLKDYCHTAGFKAVVAVQGDYGFNYAQHFKPAFIILDMQLPVVDGWTLLKKLKIEDQLRDIPVLIISAMDKISLGLEMGAIGYLKKPVDKQNLDEIFAQLKTKNTIDPKRILVVDSSGDYRKTLEKSLKEKINPIEITTAESMDDYKRIMSSTKQDCIVVNQSFKDAGVSVAELIQKETKEATIVFFTGTEAHEVVVEKTEIAINELKKKTADEFILHQAVPENNTSKVPIPVPAPPAPANIEPAALEGILKNRKVLMADDDMRNIYALSTVLETEGMNVITASDGKEALQKLNENPDVEIVLMDIMMPEMDGYEAMGEIRKDSRFANLPMFALTAKAMVGDREKCLAAGASDYVSKPINMDELLGKMKVWLYK